MYFKPEKGSSLSIAKAIRNVIILFFTVSISSVALAETGENIFKTNCGSCHSLTDKVFVGPGLQGIGDRRDDEWLLKWIKNSSELIASGDEQAVAVFEEFNKVQMPGYAQFSDAELMDLIIYIKEQGAAVAADPGAVASTTDSGTPTGTTANPPVNSQFIFWLILLTAVAAFVAYRYVAKTKRKITEMGFHPDAHKVKNYPAIFVLYIVLAAGAIYLLVNFLQNKTGMINQLMFMVLPYLAFAIFLIGSVYRYTKKGFKVSSLSSQFIEGKKLFWGSQPFHWGILFLFCGHLIAFLFPRAVLAWNGEPVRLLILEGSSFAFGLSALFGLILLIKRRLSTKALLVVTNKMDMVVYVILLTQIVSGLGVAYFVRWGSSWFSSVLTPYLRSIFSFNPDIDAVVAMPWWIQLHIISAFAIIAIIPFTRFMHFLVAPVDYIWRKYQVVIWNWNRSAIRNSTQHTFGKKPRNH